MFIILFIFLILLLTSISTIFLMADGYCISSIVVIYMGLFLIIACTSYLTIKQKSNNDINTRYEELTSEKIETKVQDNYDKITIE